ncbi:MAG: RCC1 domain-containing protein, partial [Acidobacteriota bacterium]
MRRSAETAARAFRLAPLVALCIGCGAASPEAPGRVASTGATTPPVRAAAGPAAPATAPPAPAYTELPPEGPGPVPRVVSIAVARHGTCAVDDRGGVHCWGLAAPGPSRIRVRPERLRGIDDATAVVGGDYATFCLLRREHPTTCWEGAREEGPREIPELRPASADDLAVGDDVICALAAGRVSCVGSNGIDRTLPGDLEEVEALRVFRHSFFVRRARDRRTLCAGLPVYDQCLDGDTRGTGLRELPIDGVTDLWGDGSHGAVCARLRGGEVLCWGEGIRPSAPARHQPRRIPALRDAVRVVPFAASACGLVPGGQVRCVPFHDGPDRVLVAGGATALVAAESHACALVGRGEVRCWGDERLGRLGNDAGELVSRPRRVAGVDDAVRLVSAPSATYVLRRTGELSRVGRRAAGAAEGAAELEVVSTGAADDSVGLCGRRAGGTSEGEVVRWARGA